MKIIVAIDFSDITEKLLEHSASMATATKAELLLIHVAEPHPDHVAFDYDPVAISAIDPAEIRDNIAQRFHQEHKSIQGYSEEMRNKGIDCKALMIQGPIVEVLLDEAKKLSADFIIVGSHGKGLLGQMFLGSISEELVKKTTLPVHLVPSD